MKVTRVETRCVTVKLDKPIGSALGQLLRSAASWFSFIVIRASSVKI
jgi:hypothetical protein